MAHYLDPRATQSPSFADKPALSSTGSPAEAVWSGQPWDRTVGMTNFETLSKLRDVTPISESKSSSNALTGSIERSATQTSGAAQMQQVCLN
jgi:hypothetical protein